MFISKWCPSFRLLEVHDRESTHKFKYFQNWRPFWRYACVKLDKLRLELRNKTCPMVGLGKMISNQNFLAVQLAPVAY